MIVLFTHVSGACSQGLFQYDRIDFFKETAAPENAAWKSAQDKLELIEDEWAEPVIGPSGKASIYVPPKEVREFLDKPGPQNARAYLEWNLKRIRKFIMAQEMLAREAKMLNHPRKTKNGAGRDTFRVNPSASSAKDKVLQGGYLFYFMLKDCHACEEEALVIEDIYLNHPEIRVQAFAVGFTEDDLRKFTFPAMQDNGMSALFKINSYPAIVLFNGRRERYFFPGYVGKEKILQLFE